MRSVLSTLILFLLFLICPSAKQITVEHQLVDFDVFKRIILSKQGKMDLHVPSDSILLALDLLENTLSKELSLVEQYKEYTSTLSLIQCGHTQIHPTKSLFKEWLRERNSLPIDYRLHGRKLFVNKLASQDHSFVNQGKPSSERKKRIPVGSEIIRIDSLTVSEMMSKISPFLSSDENGIEFKYFQASELFEFYRHLSVPFEKDSVEVTFVDGKDTSCIFFQPGTAPVYSINKRMLDASIASKENDRDLGKFKIINSKYGYFRFKSFKSCSGKYYELFLEKSFQKIRSRSIDKLIIDLRGNTGGVMQYSLMRYFVGEDVYLGKYVIEKPKSGRDDKHIKKWNPDYRRYLLSSWIQKRLRANGEFKNGEIRTNVIDKNLVFSGDIVVITDEGTFSSASILACHLKTLCGSKIVGRPSGGSFHRGNAGTLHVRLPYSEFKLFVNPNTFYSNISPISDATILKQPDMFIPSLYLKPEKLDLYYLQRAMKAIP